MGAFLVLSLPYKQRLSSKATKLPTYCLASQFRLCRALVPGTQPPCFLVRPTPLPPPPLPLPLPPLSLGGIPHFNLGRDGISATLPRLSVKQ